MRSSIIILGSLFLLVGCTGTADMRNQVPSRVEVAMPFTSCANLKQHLAAIVELADPVERDAALDELWETLRGSGAFPFVDADSVMFLYRGPATDVTFTGDFNGWNPAPPRAVRMGDSDVWIQQEVFPVDSRLDYKVVRDGSIWTLDPENHRVQRSGFGDNSELRMPGYVASPHVVRRDDVPPGRLVPGSLASAALGYSVNYQVYTPARYHAGLSDLPVIYVTDGHEYADDVMGSMVIVLDNLIARGLVRPMIAVFIDPRVGGRNLRAEQYILNPQFVRFVADELVPAIDAAWNTSADRCDRGILGTSLGGLNSAWFALQAGDTFKRIAIQSPAFHVNEGAIVDLYRQAPRLDVDLFISWGTFHDFGETSLQFKALLDEKGYDYTHVVVNEGHSWGNWRALLDDVLVTFWPGDRR